MTPDEAKTIAAAANTLRPAWATKSMATMLHAHHGHRPARHVLLALMYVILDPATQTPARINGPGPWWDLTNPTSPTGPRYDTPCPEHPHHVVPCPTCAAAGSPKPANFNALVEAARAQARDALHRQDHLP